MTEREQLKAEIKAEIMNEIQQNKSRSLYIAPWRVFSKDIDDMIAKANFKEYEPFRTKSLIYTAIRIKMGKQSISALSEPKEIQQAEDIAKTLIAFLKNEKELA